MPKRIIKESSELSEMPRHRRCQGMGRCIEFVTDFGFQPCAEPSDEAMEEWANHCHQDLDPYHLCEVFLVWMGRIHMDPRSHWLIFGMRDLPRFPDSYDGFLEIHQAQYPSDHDDWGERGEAQRDAYQKLLLFMGRTIPKALKNSPQDKF